MSPRLLLLPILPLRQPPQLPHPARRTVVRPVVLCALLLAALAGSAAQAADVVEFLTGSRVEGKVVKIDQENREFQFEVVVGGRTYRRTYPYAKVHAVTMGGKRFVITPMKAGGAAAPGTPGGDAAQPTASTRPRSRAEVERLIETVGKTPPDWLEAAPLDYPQSLDLSWPRPAPKGWNNQKNVGQYLWDVINPNERRWASGVKLMHHILATQKDTGDLHEHTMQTLGSMYFRFFQDYPRAAFWLKKGNATSSSLDGTTLAECYWRMGDRRTAQQLLGRTLRLESLKLLGDMGETDACLKLIEQYVKSGGPGKMAYVTAGDACRSAGRNKQALAYYRKALAADKLRNDDYTRRYDGIAQASIDTLEQFELLDLSKIREGTYRAASGGYEGPVEVEVAVKAGRIERVEVVQHREKQFYSALQDVPAQIIAKQHVKGVDATSRATLTGQAIINATAKALADAASN